MQPRERTVPPRRRIPPHERPGATRRSEPPGPGPARGPAPPRRVWLLFLLLILANVILSRFLFPGPKPIKVPYTLFKQEAERGNVAKIYSRGESITGRFKSAVTFPLAPDSLTGARPRTSTDFSTTLPAFVDPGLETLLIGKGVEISAEPIQQGGNPWLGLLFSFAPALLI
ncbi:MAG TPA: ATP-dependent metallopeptidase FtsH/Yme1/Tma family protein, partial [Candidatus Polarisedimenticolia bacterium]|nr:ATP-dependent metallopeptidase FtsH/Yme1/Tma family protein [Candidatus Polarisedimenticolia bacterium]